MRLPAAILPAGRSPGRVALGDLAFGRGFAAGRLKPHDPRRG
jgi:hypothetical protein